MEKELKTSVYYSLSFKERVVLEVLNGLIRAEGAGELVCCGQPMNLLEEKTADTSTEKHVPYIERKDNKYVVKVGENTAHPMEEKHYIE